MAPRKVADSCWEAQQRAVRAEEQAKAAMEERRLALDEVERLRALREADIAALSFGRNKALKREAEANRLLERVQQDINWMLNNRKFLNPQEFDYIDAFLAQTPEEKS